MADVALTDADVDRIIAALTPYGLNRCRALSLSDVGAEVWLPGRRPDAWDPAGEPPRTLILIGHGGRSLWEAVHGDPTFDFDGTPDPIDTWSIDRSATALDRVVPSIERCLLYPAPDCPMDLVALGRAMGWHSASPLGLGIHHGFGLWSAFRALWLLDVTADLSPAPVASDVCIRCETHDCVAACPVNAVEFGRDFAVKSCLEHRSKLNSECGETCLARAACPVGIEHRYDGDQMAYHYRLSRPSGEVGVDGDLDRPS
ncbi:MAG: hypothetical protein OEZ14_01570 [Acidimicrobiia bacterium]|nr:hypothetical protein [Acidimicrobiia bacterium]MDH5519198.1 hypothetical protein [Acidimicrobiia bacterium]